MQKRVKTRIDNRNQAVTLPFRCVDSSADSTTLSIPLMAMAEGDIEEFDKVMQMFQHMTQGDREELFEAARLMNMQRFVCSQIVVGKTIPNPMFPKENRSE